MALLGAALASCQSSRSASTTIGPDVRPEPVAAPDAGAVAVVVVITRTEILVDGAPVLPLPSREEVAASGVGARYKRSANPDDLYVVPLSKVFLAARAGDTSSRDRGSTALVIADPTTPYRLLMEVLFTLGQSEFGDYHLLAAGEKRPPRITVPPSIERWDGGRPAGRSLNLAVFVTEKGLSVKTSAGNVAPGCVGEGSGLTFPRGAAGHELGELAACTERLRARRPEWSQVTQVTLAANPGVDFATVLSVMDALRERGGKELFPEVHFGVLR